MKTLTIILIMAIWAIIFAIIFLDLMFIADKGYFIIHMDKSLIRFSGTIILFGMLSIGIYFQEKLSEKL